MEKEGYSYEAAGGSLELLIRRETGQYEKPWKLREYHCSFRQYRDGHNPVCGDKLTVYVVLGDDDRIEEIKFDGDGCAISTASASLMTEFVKGKTLAQAGEAFERFHDVVTGPPGETPDVADLGKLAVFAGVREYPMRVKCATLSWHTLTAALDASGNTAKTE